MPKCFEAFGYIIFFWSNENDPLEPVHVHVGKRIGPGCTKIWILSDGSAEIQSNGSRIPQGDLRKVRRVVESYADVIVRQWEGYFGEEATFVDRQ